MDRRKTSVRGVDALMDGIDWGVVKGSFEKYFERLGQEGCFLVLDDVEIFIFVYENMKFENEDNWGED